MHICYVLRLVFVSLFSYCLFVVCVPPHPRTSPDSAEASRRQIGQFAYSRNLPSERCFRGLRHWLSLSIPYYTMLCYTIHRICYTILCYTIHAILYML